ncbi:MAG: hypothetical protein IKJ24_05125 [Clostridia bacterium]|nr:hypothetical protein [Clostridia bacterium]
MAVKKTKAKRQSLFVGFADRLTAIIYSFFVNGRVGDMLSSHDTLCKRSFLARTLSKNKGAAENTLLKYPDALMERSISSRVLLFIRGFLASVKLNVYGTFFVFYGLISTIAYLIPAFMTGFAVFDDYAVITSGIIMIVAIPLLFSSQSAVVALASSRFLRRMVLNVLCVPEERIKVKRQYGGTVCTFVASILGMGCGVISFFTHPLYIPILILCLMAVFLVFAFPETGIIITLAALPFMQYLPSPHIVLFIMILITTVSYFCKVFQRKREFTLSPEISMVMLFCGFIATGGMFTDGGMQTFADSLAASVYILGGFLLTYNLVNTEKMLSACLKTITASFTALCLVGIWESVYHGISDRVIDTLSPTISNIAKENILYILDNGAVFGMFAILVFPVFFAYVIKRKSFRGMAAITTLGVILLTAAWMCSHYEIIVALAIELILFWFIYSHQTMTWAILIAVPVGIVALLYPYAVKYFSFPDVSRILMEYMPAGMPDSELHSVAVRDTVNMIKDGNWLGIGVGPNAYVSAFSSYSSEASMGATQPMSVWLQILCWSGAFGLASFIVFLIFMTKRSLGFFISSDNKEQRSKALAMFTGITVSLLLGATYGIWEDVRVLYLFWVCAGILLGYVRVGTEDDEARRAGFKSTDSEKDVTVKFFD